MANRLAGGPPGPSMFFFRTKTSFFSTITPWGVLTLRRVASAAPDTSTYGGSGESAVRPLSSNVHLSVGRRGLVLGPPPILERPWDGGGLCSICHLEPKTIYGRCGVSGSVLPSPLMGGEGYPLPVGRGFVRASCLARPVGGLVSVMSGLMSGLTRQLYIRAHVGAYKTAIHRGLQDGYTSRLTRRRIHRGSRRAYRTAWWVLTAGMVRLRIGSLKRGRGLVDAWVEDNKAYVRGAVCGE